MSNDEMPVIRYDVPIPTTQNRRCGVAEIMRNAKDGAYFELDEASITRNGIYSSAKHVGIKVIIRKLPNGKLGVWRVA